MAQQVVASAFLRHKFSAASEWPSQWLTIIILLLPVSVTFLYVQEFAVEIPMWDDWDFIVPHIQHLAAGQLQWSDINVQHNDALVFFPELVALGLARATGYQLTAAIYVSYLFLCGCLILLYLLFRLLRLPGRWSVLWFAPIALLFLGWRQSDSLLWSTMLMQTMALFFSLATLYCCTQA